MGCIFCDIAAGKIPSEMVYEDDRVCAFYDVNPVAPVHILIIPKKHLESVNAVGAGERELAGHIIMVAAEISKKVGIAEDGYRIVNNCGENGGQTVGHLHFHLLGGRALAWPPG